MDFLLFLFPLLFFRPTITTFTNSPIRRHRQNPLKNRMEEEKDNCDCANSGNHQMPTSDQSQMAPKHSFPPTAMATFPSRRSRHHPSPFVASSLPLLLLCFITIFHSPVLALPRPEPPAYVPIGGVFTMDKGNGVQKVPIWVKSGPEQLYGIPQMKDIGKHQIQMKERTVTVEVKEDQQSLCGPDSSTIWLEIVDSRKLSQLSIEEQYNAVQTLLATLKDVGVRAEDIRLIPFSYLANYRTVMEKIHELDDEEGPVVDEQMVFVMNISCGELTEQATEIINAVAENGPRFQVVQGTLKKAKVQQQSPTPKTTMDNLKNGEKEGGGRGGNDASSAMVVSLVLLIILLALIIGLALYWLKNKQARRRQKEATENGKGGSNGRPTALANNDVSTKNVAALSPDSQNTVTTPMLQNDLDEAKKS